MGIRVSKCMGYGLSNLIWEKTGKYKKRLNDPRIDGAKFRDRWDIEYDKTNIMEMDSLDILKFADENSEKITQMAHKEDLNKRKISSMTEALRAGMDSLRFSAGEIGKEDSHVGRNMKHRDLGRTFYLDGEFGKQEVFMIAPMSCPSWLRYDNTMDWHEETCFYKQENRYEYLRPFGIYPYNQVMVRFRGEPQESSSEMYRRYAYEPTMTAQHYSMLVGLFDDHRPPIIKEDALQDLLENWRCKIPMEIYVQLLALGFIKDVPEFVNQLRPMLYVYWS